MVNYAWYLFSLYYYLKIRTVFIGNGALKTTYSCGKQAFYLGFAFLVQIGKITFPVGFFPVVQF